MTEITPPVAKGFAEHGPATAFKFWVEIENIVVAEFKECSGLRMERDYEKIEEGGANDRLTFLPGRNKYSNIVLKYGIDHDQSLWNWYQEGIYDGRVKRISFSILVRNTEGDIQRRWNVLKGFPVKWEGPSLNVETNQVAVETLEIAHHGLALDSR
jgi:phage tail-like protein